jgi:hypothetical protein
MKWGCKGEVLCWFCGGKVESREHLEGVVEKMFN